MNTYTVQFFPDGWSPSATPNGYTVTVQAHEFMTSEDYVVFVDDSAPPRAVFALPHEAVPIITRTAVE